MALSLGGPARAQAGAGLIATVSDLTFFASQFDKTDAEARAKQARMYAAESDNFLRRIVQLSNISEIDFSRFDRSITIFPDAMKKSPNRGM